MKLNFKKLGGLIPVVVQDNVTLQVLMVGFMNEEAYKKTLKTNKVTFYSRTKKCLWEKGGVSGNYLEVKEIKKDCDNDSLLILVNPKGPTCHTGKYSCFAGKEDKITFLNELFFLIKKRKKERLKNSYTTSLFDKGLDQIVKKINEESFEVIIAAKNETKNRLIEESGDLLYHLMVLLAEKDISLEEIVKELIKRNNS